MNALTDISPARTDTTTHLYTVGQAVRLKGGFIRRYQVAGIYRITAALPPREGEFPQYRIRNNDEPHERVTTQDNLELVDTSSKSEGATLIDRIFGQPK